jgi:hypothetical protein
MTNQPSFASLLFLAAAACTTADTGDAETDGPGGKADDFAALRSMMFATDDGAAAVDLIRQPDGATSVEARDGDNTETVIDNGDCAGDFDGITCSLEDHHVIVTRTQGNRYDAVVYDGPDEGPTLGRELALALVRLSHDRSGGSRARLVVDLARGAASWSVTPAGGVASQARELLDDATCDIDDGILTCVADERPVDGALTILRVAPKGDFFVATVRRQGMRLDGATYDTTDTLDDGLSIR